MKKIKEKKLACGRTEKDWANYAASEWISISCPYIEKFLKENDYRKLRLEDFS